MGSIRVLTASGVWSLVNQAGRVLLDGLDLLIADVCIDPVAMGVLSLGKMAPNLISNVVSSVAGVFAPDFTILYAEGHLEELVRSVRRSMKILGLIVNIPVIGLIVCGVDFYALWQPTQDPVQLEVLSLLTAGGVVISGGINTIFGIFTVVNRLKFNALAVVGSGAVSSLLTLLFVQTTDWGIYAVAGVSTVVSIVRNLAFTAPYGAACLGLKWYAFYPDVFRPALFVVVSSGAAWLASWWIPGDSWPGLFVRGAVTGVTAVLIGFFIVLNGDERRYLLDRARRRK